MPRDAALLVLQPVDRTSAPRCGRPNSSLTLPSDIYAETIADRGRRSKDGIQCDSTVRLYNESKLTSRSRARTDSGYRYRPSSSRANNIGQSSPTSATQMYAHSSFPFQQHPPPPVLQHMSRSSPPQPTWAVPQSHNSYYAGTRGSIIPSRNEHAQSLQRPDINTTGAPGFDNVTLSNSMATSAQYFPNVIDTSMFHSNFSKIRC